MPPARRTVLQRLLTGRFTISMFPAATHAQQAAARAPMEVGTSLVISRQAMHSTSEDISPRGASSWDEVSDGSGAYDRSKNRFKKPALHW